MKLIIYIPLYKSNCYTIKTEKKYESEMKKMTTIKIIVKCPYCKSENVSKHGHRGIQGTETNKVK
jgi:transposase-like protein